MCISWICAGLVKWTANRPPQSTEHEFIIFWLTTRPVPGKAKMRHSKNIVFIVIVRGLGLKKIFTDNVRARLNTLIVTIAKPLSIASLI